MSQSVIGHSKTKSQGRPAASNKPIPADKKDLINRLFLTGKKLNQIVAESGQTSYMVKRELARIYAANQAAYADIDSISNVQVEDVECDLVDDEVEVENDLADNITLVKSAKHTGPVFDPPMVASTLKKKATRKQSDETRTAVLSDAAKMPKKRGAPKKSDVITSSNKSSKKAPIVEPDSEDDLDD